MRCQITIKIISMNFTSGERIFYTNKYIIDNGNIFMSIMAGLTLSFIMENVLILQIHFIHDN